MKKLFLLLLLTGTLFRSTQAAFYLGLIPANYSLTQERITLSAILLTGTIINPTIGLITKAGTIINPTIGLITKGSRIKDFKVFPSLPAVLLIMSLLHLGLPNNEIMLANGINFNLNAKRLLTLSALTMLGTPRQEILLATSIGLPIAFFLKRPAAQNQ